MAQQQLVLLDLEGSHRLIAGASNHIIIIRTTYKKLFSCDSSLSIPVFSVFVQQEDIGRPCQVR